MSKILIIDIETTGWLQNGGKIVEIGAVELDLDNAKIKKVFDKVCHERPILRIEVENSWIVQNSSLTVEEVQHSPQLIHIQEEFQSVINSYPLGATAYNNAFDFGFLEDRGFVFPNKLPCPMKLSTNICKIPGKKGYKWPSVEEAWKFFFPDHKYIEKHRGADDALHEAYIVWKLYAMGVFKLS